MAVSTVMVRFAVEKSVFSNVTIDSADRQAGAGKGRPVLFALIIMQVIIVRVITVRELLSRLSCGPNHEPDLVIQFIRSGQVRYSVAFRGPPLSISTTESQSRPSAAHW